ncbi:MAG: hypothetical protein WC910_07365 [Bacteroidales bacterium]|jgi:hypothetical protein
MLNIFEKINKSVLEPNLYALVVKTPEREVLHIGVHFSLDEAYEAACQNISRHMTKEQRESTEITMEMWESMTARNVVIKMSDPNKIAIDEPVPVINDQPAVPGEQRPPEIPPVETCINDFKRAKNVLLARLIDEGDPRKIERMSAQVITANEKRLVLKKIADKTAVPQKNVEAK